MTRDEIQQKSVEEWVKNGKKGTLALATGTGKTIAALHCLCTMPKKDGKVHLFLAETIEREQDLISDIQLFNKLFNINIFNEYNLKFKCYQTVYKYKDYDFGLVIADELHNALSPEYFKFFQNNNYDAIVGLSATIDKKTSYDIEGNKISKGEMLDNIAPICFNYTLSQAKEDGIGRKFSLKKSFF
jgi:superfamily II DNA or RNA helicase